MAFNDVIFSNSEGLTGGSDTGSIVADKESPLIFFKLTLKIY